MEREVVAVERRGGVRGRRLDKRLEFHAVDRAAGLGRERKRTELTDRPRGAEAPRHLMLRGVDRQLEIDPFHYRDRPEVVRLPGGDNQKVFGRQDKLDRNAV